MAYIIKYDKQGRRIHPFTGRPLAMLPHVYREHVKTLRAGHTRTTSGMRSYIGPDQKVHYVKDKEEGTMRGASGAGQASTMVSLRTHTGCMMSLTVRSIRRIESSGRRTTKVYLVRTGDHHGFDKSKDPRRGGTDRHGSYVVACMPHAEVRKAIEKARRMDRANGADYVAPVTRQEEHVETLRDVIDAGDEQAMDPIPNEEELDMTKEQMQSLSVSALEQRIATASSEVETAKEMVRRAERLLTALEEQLTETTERELKEAAAALQAQEEAEAEAKRQADNALLVSLVQGGMDAREAFEQVFGAQ